ncbi:hypothetical protein, partial [Hydrogenimonas sp.]
NNVRNEMTKYELSKLQDMIFEAAQPVFEGVKRATNYAKMGLRAPKQKPHGAFRKKKAVEKIKKEMNQQTEIAIEMSAKEAVKMLKLVYKEERERLKASNEATQRDYMELKQRYQDVKKQIEELKSQPPEVVEKIVEKEVRVEVPVEKIVRIENTTRIEKLEKELQEAKLAQKEAEARVRVPEEENARILAENERLRGEIEELKKKEVEWKDEKRTLGAEIERLEKALERRMSVVEEQFYKKKLIELAERFVVPFVLQNVQLLPDDVFNRHMQQIFDQTLDVQTALSLFEILKQNAMHGQRVRHSLKM